MNKKIAAVVMASALSLGTVATAQADTGRMAGVPTQVATVLSGLVTTGTITQAQADAITAAITAAAPVRTKIDGMGSMGVKSAAHQALIISTLGITAADLSAARLAGKSLATLAGDKKAALITALVNLETTEIDAAVTAGKLTATQATTAKAGLTARITKQVEAVPGSKIGGMGKGNHNRDGAGAAKPMSLKKRS
jgi:hypothetical protein